MATKNGNGKKLEVPAASEVQMTKESYALSQASDRLAVLELEGTSMLLQNLMLPKEREVLEKGISDDEIPEVAVAKGDKKANRAAERESRNRRIVEMAEYKQEHWKERAHYDAEGRYGVKVEGFLRAISAIISYVKLSCADLVENGKDIARCIQIVGNTLDQEGSPIQLFSSFTGPECHKHWAKLQGRTPIPVYRPGFPTWTVELRVEFNGAILSDNDIMTLFNRAGRFVGIGAWRPECRGSFGRFQLKSAKFVDLSLPVKVEGQRETPAIKPQA